MKDDDPEERIRELERGVAEPLPVAPDLPSPHEAGLSPPRKRRFPWYFGVGIVLLVAVSVGYAATAGRSNLGRSPLGHSHRTARSNGPTEVPQGGTLRVSNNFETKTIACNDGNLTFAGFDNKYSVTGHCASLKVGGYDNNITVDNADTLESSGYGNTVRAHACNNCNLTLSAYRVGFYVTGHCATLTISSYDDRVAVDSIDNINLSGYNNTVIYHSGAPKVTDSGHSNTIQQR
jgi:hypothetical protein